MPALHEPQEGRCLVLVGQNNPYVGGQPPRYTSGYVDHVSPAMGVLPAGISAYTNFSPGWTNRMGITLRGLDGLLEPANWGSGDMCLSCYLNNPNFTQAILHIGVSMEGGHEKQVAAGAHDELVGRLAAWCQTSGRRILMRIGYEFNGAWNNYEPQNYVAAFRRVVEIFRKQQVTNVAFCFAASQKSVEKPVLERYYPGDEFVDWMGYSYFPPSLDSGPVNDFAAAHNKPLIMAECCPLHFLYPQADARQVWDTWFAVAFEHIRRHPQVKAFAYINDNWRENAMWVDPKWGDTRLESNPEILAMWVREMKDPRWLHGPSIR